MTKAKKVMNKTDFLDAVAKNVDYSKAVVNSCYVAILDQVTKNMKKGISTQWTGFGTFSPAARAARTGRNPATGKTIKIAACKTPKFKAGKLLKDAIQ